MSLAYPIFKWEQSHSFKQFWDHNQIKEQVFRRELARNPSFINCFNPRLNLTNPFLADVRNKTHGEHPNSVVIQIIGGQGSGKSTLGFVIGPYIYPKFANRNIFFRYEALFEYCKLVKKNEALMLDEQPIEFGEGSQRQIKELQNIEEITRILSVHLIYCSPTLREHLASHYTLKVIQRNAEKRLTKFAFCSQDGNYYYGYGIAQIPKDKESDIYKKYEPIKLDFAQRVLERDLQKYDTWAKARKLSRHSELKYAHKKLNVEIQAQDTFPTLTTGEIKKIVNAYLMLIRKLETANPKAV